jgi:hypothetical protein
MDPEKYLVIRGGRHEDVSFTGRHLVKFTPIGAVFVRCDFSKLDVDDMGFGSGFDRSEYHECVFDGAKLRMGAVGQARFVSCSFRGTSIRRLECESVEFVDCTFSGSIRGGYIKARRPGLPPNEVTGNDFSGARLTDFVFKMGVDLTRQKLPQSPDYLYLPDGPAAAAAARTVLDDCPSDLRPFANLMIEWVEELAAEGQQQVWFRRKELFPRHRDAVTWVLDLWEKDGYATPPP